MTTDSETQKWRPCPQGTLSGLSTGLKRRRRREELTRVAAIVSMLLIAVTAGWYTVRSTADHPEFNFGGIACSEVQQAMPTYLNSDGQNGDHAIGLEKSVIARIDKHLAACPHCQEFMRQMRPARAHAGMRPAHAHAGIETFDPLTHTLASASF